ncbi:unknown [Clostridium sp. CAG:448]|nr:unknown [Clostridium sp. CAG:448]
MFADCREIGHGKQIIGAARQRGAADFPVGLCPCACGSRAGTHTLPVGADKIRTADGIGSVLQQFRIAGFAAEGKGVRPQTGGKPDTGRSENLTSGTSIGIGKLQNQIGAACHDTGCAYIFVRNCQRAALDGIAAHDGNDTCGTGFAYPPEQIGMPVVYRVAFADNGADFHDGPPVFAFVCHWIFASDFYDFRVIVRIILTVMR